MIGLQTFETHCRPRSGATAPRKASRKAKHRRFVVRPWDEAVHFDAAVYDCRPKKRVKIPGERCITIVRWSNGDTYYGCIDCLPPSLQAPVNSDEWATEAIKYINRAYKAGIFRWLAL